MAGPSFLVCTVPFRADCDSSTTHPKTQSPYNMPDFKGLAKGGWHPEKRGGGKEGGIRSEFKGVNTIVRATTTTSSMLQP